MNSRRKRSTASPGLYGGTAIAALMMLYPLAAFAQPAGDENVESVTVTGTSIKGSAPVGANVITVDRAAMEATGATSIQQLLTNVPSVTGFGNAGQGGYGSADNSGTFAPAIHSLGASASNSTLVLVDSHRIPLSGLAHSLADPSTIPQIALQRVEVLPDGASSIYGSDAVAGVLNFITRKNFSGAETELEYGAGLDYNSVSFGQIIGATWDKGSVMAAYNFVGRSELLGTDRSFVNDDQNFRGLSNFGNYNCGPAAISASTTGTTYLYPYTGAGIARTAANAPCGQTPAGGTTGGLLPSENRHAAMVSITDQVADWLTVSSDLNWSNRTDNAAVSRGVVTAIVFGPGSGKGTQINPFYVPVPGSATGTQVVSYDFNSLLGSGAHTKFGTGVIYGTVDASITLPGDWTAAIETMFGNSVSDTRSLGTVCTACAYLALNGTTNASGSLTTSANPAVLGTTTITTRPLSLANALNVWGVAGSTAALGANTAAAVQAQLLDNDNFSQTTQNMNDVNLRLNGTLFSLPAGDVKTAFGGEYRNYGLWQYAIQNGSSGPSSTNSAILNASFGRSLYAAYAEFLIPVIGEDANVPLVRKLSFDISGRYDKYSDVGDTKNPRVAVDWQIVDGLKARGSYGTSFVAPPLTSTGGAAGITTESQVGYLAGIGGSVTVPANYPNMGTGNAINCSQGCTVGAANSMGVIVAGPGGAGVQPETALTYSAGLDFEPGKIWRPLDGLLLSATYWQTKFVGAITSPVIGLDAQIAALNKNLIINPSQAQIDAAYASGRAVVSVVSGPVTFLQYYTQQNAFNLYANGIDFSADYRFSLDNWGDFNAGLEGSSKLRFDQQGGGYGGAIVNNLNRNANVTFSSLGLTARATFGWHLDPVKLNIAVNYTGSYYEPVSAPAIASGFTASSRFIAGYYIVPVNVTTDVSAAYDLPAFNPWVSGTEIYVVAQNVFNQAPPPYNAAVGYDTLDANPLGRLVMFGLRKKW